MVQEHDFNARHSAFMYTESVPLIEINYDVVFVGDSSGIFLEIALLSLAIAIVIR